MLNKVDSKSLQSISPRQRTTGTQGMLGEREMVFPREKHSNQFLDTKCSAQKTDIQVTVYRLSSLYLCIYEYIHTYIHMFV